MKKRTGPLPWKSEAALCDEFARCVRALGWTPYPETAGFDLLLVARDGTQIGVEAKLRPCLTVLAQVIERAGTAFREAPDYIAILVGRGHREFELIARNLGFPVIDGGDAEEVHDTRAQILKWRARSSPGSKTDIDVDPDLNPWRQLARDRVDRWRRRDIRFPLPRCVVPTFVPDLRAGIPGPVLLTAWKVKAIQLCQRLRAKGYVTTQDFEELALDHTRWVRGAQRWLDDSGEREGRRTKYVPREGRQLPDEQRPELTAQVLARLAAGDPTGGVGIHHR